MRPVRLHPRPSLHHRGLRPALAAAAALLLVAGSACSPRGSEEAEDGSYDERVAAEHAGDRPVAGAAAEAAEDVEVTTREEVYGTLDGRELRGYLAQPAGAELRPDDGLPGLLVVHEWWGLNDNVETMARMFAQQGYETLAVDLFGGEVAEDPDRARQLTQAVDESKARDNLRQAVRYVAEELQAPRVGVVGWCFGGRWSLDTALAAPADVDATVVYYGQPVTERDRLARLEAPFLGIYGAEDSSIPVDQVRRLESTLRDLGKDVEVHVYDGAGHAFANPSGDRYEPEAARDAWEKTLAFLAEHLKASEDGAAGP
jgi:carboxymethylenebutenolidase